ncbi:MAG: DoxX family protein [Actinobacteria bacterium]|nr:DoxX family protein [Actinomycetota bacterium]
MAYGILFLRLVLGLTMAGHGAQKLFGWFGGPGPQGVAGFMGTLRFRTPRATGLLLGMSELGGGMLVAAGLVTPFAALAVAVVMLNAIALAHWRNGFWNTNGGFEFPLLVWAGVVSVAATGGARFSVDHALGWAGNLSGVWWGVGVLGVSALVSFLTLVLWRRPETPVAEEEGHGSLRQAA